MPSPAILIADEDTDTRIILRTLLERHGYAISEAASPDAALTLAQHTAFDLVILNHPMRNANGRTLVQQLRAIESLRYVPILNVTSRVIPHLLEEAHEQGVTATMAKPIEVEDVLSAVRELTARRLVHAS